HAHRLADTKLPYIGRLLARDHAEQRRLASPVRADHADDPARRKLERELVDQQAIAVSLPQAARLDDHVAETGSRRDMDLIGGNALSSPLLFCEDPLVGAPPGFSLALPRPRRHPDPLELALQRAPARRRLLLLLLESKPLLFEPRRVVPLPGDAFTAVELQN